MGTSCIGRVGAIVVCARGSARRSGWRRRLAIAAMVGFATFASATAHAGGFVVGDDGSQGQRSITGAPPAPNTMSTTEKGSFFVLPKIELRYWNFDESLVQDTIVHLANDYPEDVRVQMFFVNGDPPDIKGPHPGWNWIDNLIVLPANGTASWNASSGSGLVSPFTALDPAGIEKPPGRPADADGDINEHMLRGFIVGWAVDDEGYPVRHNHLMARADVVRNSRGQMWGYNGWHAQVVDPAIAQGARVIEDGLLALDGVTYDAPPAELWFPFIVPDSFVYGDTLYPQARTGDATLVALDFDFRQVAPGPPATRADYTLWNESGTTFTGMNACMTLWDETTFENFAAPNHFLALGTERGLARVDGIADPGCADSAARGLVGVVTTLFDYGDLAYAAAGAAMFGVGQEPAVLQYDVSGPPPPDAGEDLLAATLDDVLGHAPEGGLLPAGGAAAAAGVPTEDRVDGSSPGSAFVVPDVEVRWNADDEVIRDTIVTVANVGPAGSLVRLAFVQGDPSGPNGAQGIEMGHTVQFLDDAIDAHRQLEVRASGPTWGTLDPGQLPGRVDPLTGERSLRGFIVGWAVFDDGAGLAPIRFDHLVATAHTLYYIEAGGPGAVSRMNAYQFRAVAGTADGDVIGAPDDLRFDGTMYARGFDQLAQTFPAAGSTFYGDGFPFPNGRTDALVTLLTLDRAWGDQHAVAPETTRTRFTVWNTFSVEFIGLAACVEGWSRRRASEPWDNLPFPAMHETFLQTPTGRFRANGLGGGAPCFDAVSAGILGALETELRSTSGSDLLRDVARVPLVGMGREAGGMAPPDVPIGDCCTPAGRCWFTDEASCYAGGGVAWNTPATGNCSSCSDEIGACCFTTGCQELMPTECVVMGGSPQGPGSTCAGTMCDVETCCFGPDECLPLRGDTLCASVGGSWGPAGTGCFDGTSPCVGGACCLTDGACDPGYFTSTACEADGGTWAAGQTCADVDCEDGACCLMGGSCIPNFSVEECENLGGAFQGAQSTCAPSSCTAGACCLDGGDCTDLPDIFCTAFNGDWYGAGTTCGSIPPCPGFGFCCFGTDVLGEPTCGTTSMTQCESVGGLFLGDEDCFDTPCPQGACCLADLSCEDLNDVQECSAFGGVAYRRGEACDSATCLGVCCLTDGSCAPTPTGFQCAQLGGRYFAGVACGSINCDTGACCVGGGCIDFIPEGDCTAMGGSFLGPLPCDQIDGPDVDCALGACCLPGGSCTETDGPTCIAAGGYALGAGSTCGSGNCRAPGDIRTTRKISATTGGLAGLTGNARFGSGIARLGDIDGDGTPDVAAGAYLFTDPAAAEGSVFILRLNPDGTVKSQQRIGASAGGLMAALEPLDAFGWSTTSIGDLDGDGRNELAVGALWDDDGGETNAGAVYVLFLNADGTVRDEQKLSATAGGFPFALGFEANFGSSIAAAGDLDGDGVPDIVVGARGVETVQTSGGAVYVLLLNADGTVKEAVEVLDEDAPSGALFGASIARVDDPGMPGVTRFVCGLPLADIGGTDRGGLRFLDVSWTFGALDVGLGASFSPASVTQDVTWYGWSVGAVGDLNGDGVGEITVGAPQHDPGDEGGVWLYLSDGEPSFDVPRLLTVGGLDPDDRFGVSARGVGDVDGDGVPEIAVGSTRDDDGEENAGALRILFMGGAPDVTWTVIELPTMDEIVDTIIDDLTGDLLPDVIGGLPGGFPGPGGALQVFVNAGSSGGAWGGLVPEAPVPAGPAPARIASGDLDADEDVDVAVVDGQELALRLLENDGTGALTVSQLIELPGLATDVAVGDPDDDGAANVVVALPDAQLVESYGPAEAQELAGGVTYALLDAYPAPAGPAAVALADLDGDGDDDLVIAGRGASGEPDDAVHALELEGGAVVSTSVASVGLDPERVAVGDVDGDGRPDVVTLNGDDTITVLRGDGAGGLERALDVPTGDAARSLAVADLDADGDADVVTTGCDPELGAVVTIFESEAENAPDGAVILGAPTEVETPGEPLAIAVGDLDGDGAADLAVGGSDPDGGGSMTTLLGDAAMDEPCPGDLDGNDEVGFGDLLAVLSGWGACPPACPEDLDASGDVGFGDLLIVLAAWGPCS